MKRLSCLYALLIVVLLTPTYEAVGQTTTRGASDLVEMEMLARAERRAEDFRSRLLDLQMKEIEIQAYLEYLDYRMRPENIQKALELVGSPRPMDELRNDLRMRLESEKERVNRRLELLGSTRDRLEAAIREADKESVRLRKQLGLPSPTGAGEEGSAPNPGGGDW